MNWRHGDCPSRSAGESASWLSAVSAGVVSSSRATAVSSSRTRTLKPAPDQAMCSRIPPTVSDWTIAGMPASSSSALARSASGRVWQDWTTTRLAGCIAGLYAGRAGFATGARSYRATDFGFILRTMANENNPFAGVFPRVVHPINDGETTITEFVEKIEGEVELDTYVKAQTSAPEVVKRITELENCLWRLATAALAACEGERHPELRAAAEEAKVVLKNQLEVDEGKHRFHSELGVFKDDLRIIKE